VWMRQRFTVAGPGGGVYSQREVPLCPSPVLLRSKILQDAVMQPDPLPLQSSASRNPFRVSCGSQNFIRNRTIFRTRMRAASSLAWRSASLGFGGFGRLRAATARAPSEKSSSCRGLGFFMAAP
jgi:hypothetical protein